MSQSVAALAVSNFTGKTRHQFIAYVENELNTELEDSFDQWADITFSDGSSLLIDQCSNELSVRITEEVAR